MKRSVVLVLSILLCSARAQAQLCQPLNDEYVTESSTNPAVSILWNWPLGLMPGFPATMLTVAWSDGIESPTSFNQNDNSTSVKGADGDWYTFIHEAEDGGSWAEVPAIAGCATQGHTMEELLTNLREAVEGCLASV